MSYKFIENYDSEDSQEADSMVQYILRQCYYENDDDSTRSYDAENDDQFSELSQEADSYFYHTWCLPKSTDIDDDDDNYSTTACGYDEDRTEIEEEYDSQYIDDNSSTKAFDNE